MSSLKELKTLLRTHNLKPVKRLSQNFLISNAVLVDSMRRLSIQEGDAVVEVGPGTGALTRHLLACNVPVIAIEKDPKLCIVLNELFGDNERFTLINADVLKVDLTACVKNVSYRSLKFCGNLPYHITSSIIARVIEAHPLFDYCLIMTQKEVADRLAAPPGSKTYGALSCFVQYTFTPRRLRVISHHSFYPAPGVDSALIELIPRQQPAVAVTDEKLFFQLIRALFQQRRKTVLNGLVAFHPECKAFKTELGDRCTAAGIDTSRRPETFSLGEFACLTALMQRFLADHT